MALIATASGALRAPLEPVAPNTYDGQTFTLALATETGDDIAASRWLTGPGQYGRLTVKLAHPAGTPDFSVQLDWEVLDAGGAQIDAGTGTVQLVTVTETPATIDLPPAPAGAVERVVHVRSASNPPAATQTVKRTNSYAGARCTDVTIGDWAAQNGWTITAKDTATSLPPNLKTYIRFQSTETVTGINRGILWYQSVSPTNPVAGNGWPIPTTEGAWTGANRFSFYVFSTKATTILPTVRFFHGTTWDGARIDGTSVAIAANTWTRVSVQANAPAGATHVCGWLLANVSTSWVPADYMAVSAVMIQRNTFNVELYFDGTNMGDNPQPGFTAWRGAADASSSDLYNETQAVRKLTVTDDVLSTTATAEDLIGANLERNLRRSVAEIFNTGPVRIAAGVPGLLAGQLTYLCATWLQAQAFDALHQTAGTITIGGTEAGELDGLQYVAVERTRLTAERATPGKPSKWLVAVEIREQE